MPICTQGMQRTWWPEAVTIIVTGPYSVYIHGQIQLSGAQPTPTTMENLSLGFGNITCVRWNHACLNFRGAHTIYAWPPPLICLWHRVWPLRFRTHFTNQCWITISRVCWHSPGGNFRDAQEISLWSIQYTYLTHCGLVTPHGDIDLNQHRLR